MKGYFITIILFFLVFQINAQEDELIEYTPTERTVFMPRFSYSYTSFNDIQFRNPSVNLMIARFNPEERDNFLFFSLSYNPQIVINIDPDFPGINHSASAFSIYMTGEHIINAGFITRTDKPLYGGLNTFMGMAGYSNNLIKGERFSMFLGLNLLIMDFGITLNNGTPWILWPLPIIMLNWEYSWINFSFMPFPRLEIAPKSPVGLTVRTNFSNYDVAVWYKKLREVNTARGESFTFELFAIGVGIKNETDRLMFADGKSYGINYNALYGTFRLFRLFELRGGWTFNGKEGYGDITSSGRTSITEFNNKIGQGYFFSVSGRIFF